MSAVSLVLVLFLWYTPGFVAAAVMVHRGHAAAPWWFAAWIGGALTAAVAFIWFLLRDHDVLPSPAPPDVESIPGSGLRPTADSSDLDRVHR